MHENSQPTLREKTFYLVRLVQAKKLTTDKAAHQLAEFSDGGLTFTGALDLIHNPHKWDKNPEDARNYLRKNNQL